MGRDAFELCEGLRRGIYRSIVHVPRPEISRLRDTLSRRHHFVRLQAAQVGAVKALLRAAGLGRLSRSLGSEAGWARVIAALALAHGAIARRSQSRIANGLHHCLCRRRASRMDTRSDQRIDRCQRVAEELG
jgi:transposase